MNESARHLLHVEHLVRGVLNAPCCDDEISGGNDNRALRNEKSSALNAIINADVAASGVFRMSNVGDEVFSDVYGLQQFQFRHDYPPALAILNHDTAGPGVTVNRRGVALVTIDSKAAEGTGLPSAASVHVSGATHNHNNSNHAKTSASAIPAAIASIIAALSDIAQRNPRKNQSAKKYSIINTIAAPAIHHMRTLVSFVLQSSHSLKSRLLTSAPTVVATNSVVPHSRANAGHRGCVSGQS